MTKTVQIGDWRVVLVEDDDGHLGMFATHASGTPAVDTEQDVINEPEYGVRLTCDAIEEGYEKWGR